MLLFALKDNSRTIEQQLVENKNRVELELCTEESFNLIIVSTRFASISAVSDND